MHPYIRVIIYLRLSGRTQDYNNNFEAYEKRLREKFKELNITVIACYREVSSGKILNSSRTDLVEAVKMAIKHNAVIVAPSADRFLRNRDFITKKPDILPTEAEYERLKKLTGNVPLATLLPPNMPPRKVRGYQTKLGQGAKNKGGRPVKKTAGYKKESRVKQKPIAINMFNEGYRISYISKKLNRPWSTIKDWVKSKK